MNPTHYMELIRCALNGTLPSEDIIASISLDELYEFASLNKLIPLLVTLANAWPASSEYEQELLSYWKQEAAGNVFFEYRKFALVKQLLEHADRQGISFLFFKGYILADLYPNFTMRTSSDTDLFINVSDFGSTSVFWIEYAGRCVKVLNYKRSKMLPKI